MNKLLGFFELKHSSLPTIPWNEYNKDVLLDPQYLWTIRSAVFRGDDLNLPRLVGVNASEAKLFADQLYDKLIDKGIVIYYPYFIAEKSGTLDVYLDKVVIEAVQDDLWNLVTYSDREVTIQIQNDIVVYNGNKDFLLGYEVNELLKYINTIRSMFRNYFFEGKSVLLEWSYAYNCDINKNRTGNKYLVFYEARSV